MFAVMGLRIELMKMEDTSRHASPEAFDCRAEEANHGVTLLHICLKYREVNFQRTKKKVHFRDRVTSTERLIGK
jgi:hypothetical protein